MNCAYHPASLAHVRCSNCQRGLCPACDHRIKGTPYCQDCIVAGIEMLRRTSRSGGSTPRIKEKSPNVATLFGLVPGLGAAYNGQHIKALVQFMLVAALWHLADIMPSPFGPIFALGGFAFYLFTIYDARRSAERLRAGEDLAEDEQRLRRSLRERAPLWGLVLIGFGAISFLHLFFDAQLAALWPLLLIAAGAYLLHGFRRISRGGVVNSSYRASPPSVITSPYERPDGKFANLEMRRSERRR